MFAKIKQFTRTEILTFIDILTGNPLKYKMDYSICINMHGIIHQNAKKNQVHLVTAAVDCTMARNMSRLQCVVLPIV